MPSFDKKALTPKLFLNVEASNANNQNTFHMNFLQENLKEQNKATSQLSESVTRVENRLHHTFQEQKSQQSKLSSIEEIQEEISLNVNDNRNEQKIYHTEISAMLEDLKMNLSKSGLNRELIEQVILEQLAQQDYKIQEMNRKLINYEDVSESLSQQTKKQEEMVELFLKQADLQGIFHQTIMEQFEKQEEINESINYKITEMNATLSTRFAAILDRLEDQFNKISQFILNFFLPTMYQRHFSNKKVKVKTKMK